MHLVYLIQAYGLLAACRLRAAAVHVRSVNVQKAKMQPTNVRPKQTLTDKKEV